MNKKYSRGKNPASRNRPKIGKQREIVLPDSLWQSAKQLTGNYSSGVRRMVRLANFIIQQNIASFCQKNGITESSQDAIASWLLQKFPGLETSQPKNHLNLAQEIAQGEAEIIENTRKIRIIELIIICGLAPGKRIKEFKQVYPNGNIRERRHANGEKFLVSEKIYNNENGFQAAIRGIEEELGILPSHIKSIEQIGIEEADNPDSSYQGLKSIVEVNSFQIEIHPEAHKDIYVEHQESKSTYFTWE